MVEEPAGIRRDTDGIPWIAGTTTKVVEVVSHLQAHGGDAEEIHRQLPHLSPQQVRVALAFYEDHRSEVDADLERRLQRVERLRREMPEASVVERLRETRRRQAQGGDGAQDDG